MSEQPDMLEAALGYVRRGLAVVPNHAPVWIQDLGFVCSCDKRPCSSLGKHPRHGFGQWTTRPCRNEASVRNAWRQYPDANIGVVVPPGYFVLEVDGAEAIAWADQHAGGVVTRTTVSGSGTGQHRWFKLPADTEVPNGKLLTFGGPHQEVEVCAAGAKQIVMPPSLHKSGGRYSFLHDVDAVDAPARLLEAIGAVKAQQPGSNGPASPPAPGSKIPDARKRQLILREIGKLRREGHDDQAVMFAMERWVPTYCEDPSTSGLADMVRTTAKYTAPPIPPPMLGSGQRQEGQIAEPVELPAVPEFPLGILPRAARGLVQTAEAAGLPRALAAGAALAALAAAIGPNVTLEAAPGWTERPILWVPLLAPRGAGKSPCQELAFRVVRDHDAQLWAAHRQALEAWFAAPAQNRGPRPTDPTLLVGDITVEALARRLDGRGDAVLDVDELQQTIRGFGEYKHNGGGDRGRFLSLWTGSPWRYTRVAQGRAGVDVLVARPTVVLCGGLQPALHHVLGDEQDGLRPRWLPHLANLPDVPAESDMGAGAVQQLGWLRLFGADLLPKRDQARSWKLTGAARDAFSSWQRRWKAEARGTENASVSGALVKADVHLLRVALVYAEADQPRAGGEVSRSQIERAAAHVEFTLNCWRALPEASGLALSFKDERLDRHVDRLRDWLEQHHGRATKRDLLRAHVAGVRTADDLGELLKRYAATYPGTVTEEPPATGGPVAVVVRAPLRTTRPVVAGDNGGDPTSSDDEAEPEYESTPQGGPKPLSPPGDNDPGDNDSGDNVLALPGLDGEGETT